MAHRMVSELTINQLRKMEALKGTKKSAFEYIAAIQKMNDPEVVRVTAASAAVCASNVCASVLTRTYNAARFVLDIRGAQPGVAKTQDTTRHTFIKWFQYA